MHPRQQTIFALSSGRPPSAISIIRVSGHQAGALLASLAGKIPVPRLATRVTLRDGNRQPIDDAVILWFPGPASATGEDVAELHVHGGRAVLAAVFAALSAFAEVRAAEPGEFTRRAFGNGKLDLPEAEAPDDLIHADTDRHGRQALRQLEGLLGDKPRDWCRQIIEASALMEPGEQEGVRRARARAAEADLVLWISDPEHETDPHHSEAPIWTVRNKIDLDEAEPPKCRGPVGVLRQGRRAVDFRISASRGDGI